MNWGTFQEEIELLSHKIEGDFDLIVGITRGGLIPARLLSSLLDVKKVFCLSVEKDGEERKVVTTILEDILNKKILLVEDILETGRTLRVAKAYLESKGAIVKTGCLYRMPHAEIVPDYFLRQIDVILEFPWEIASK